MQNRQQRRSAKFNPNSNTNSTTEPVMKNNIWTRIKSWVSRSTKKVATFTKTFTARIGAAFKRVANSKAVKAIAFVVPSVRRFLKNCIVFTGVVLTVAGLLVAPLTTFVTLSALYVGFLGMAWAVGKLDAQARRGARWANIVLDILDVIGQAVVFTAEVGMAVLLVAANAGASIGLVLFKLALVTCVIAIDVVARKKVADYQTRVTAAMPDAQVEDFGTHAAVRGIDPFASASSSR